MIIRWVGIDKNGVRRVWADGKTVSEARENVKKEALSYLAKRPDTGPLASWTFQVEKYK